MADPPPTTDRLSEPLKTIVGESYKKLRDQLGLETVGDLLHTYPRRYAERGELTDLSELREGDQVTVMAEVKSSKSRPMKDRRRGSMLEVLITDGTSEARLTFFNQRGGWREKQLVPGRRGLFAGKVEMFRRTVQLAHPDYVLLPSGDDDEDGLDQVDADAFASQLIPIYPTTKGLETWRFAKAIRTALDTLGPLADPVPDDVRARRGLVGLADALRLVHRPQTRGDITRARERLRYDEAFVLQVALARRRAEARALPAVPRPRVDGGLADAFEVLLPFTLTDGQVAVGETLAEEIARSHPMSRLLQGEVGSGKTVVALRAMLDVVDNGGQAALLAPTEVLAQQHHRSLTSMLGPLAERGFLGGAEQATRVALLTGSQATSARRQALLEVTSGEAGIVVGTHALLQESVEFFDLGLVVVDEQHRFGVEQRDALRAKGRTPPHVLVMTATPIPRTVAMTVFGDLEVSTLTELPQGRSPITTHVVPAAEKPTFLERTWARVREEVEKGRQVFVVCPRIGDATGAASAGAAFDGANGDGAVDDGLEPIDEGGDDAADATPRRPPLAVLDVAPMLADGPLAGLRLEVLHGRMQVDAKDDVMRRFAAGSVDVLVATTVVEVGVDVPNAAVMVVMDADRFGVSQLHQLRGRVGRGSAPGLCLLVTDSEAGSSARERLDAVAATLDGFELSRVDLEQRREGDVLGATQSGRRSSLRMLSVLRDEDVIRDAREDATELVDADPALTDHPALAAAVADAVEEEQADYLEKG